MPAIRPRSAVRPVSAVAPPDDEAREHRVRVRAHQLWELAGSPYGGENEFWLAAEAEIDSAEADRGVEQ